MSPNDSLVSGLSKTATESTNHWLCGKPGVLVVDDEHLVRIMVKLGLTRHGFRVWTAENSKESLEIFQEHQDEIDVVLMDVQIPKIDGPEILRRLRVLSPGIPACFMSGDPGVYEGSELGKGRGNFLIAKPFLFDDLSNILRLLALGETVELLPANRERQISRLMGEGSAQRAAQFASEYS